MEVINMPSIFHDVSVTACLQIDIEFGDHTTVYSPKNPIRSKISYLNKFIYNLDVKAFLQDDSILLCNC